MKQIIILILAAIVGLTLPMLAMATPPYDVTVEQLGTASTGGPADTHELWMNCDTTPVLVDADVVVPETYPGLLTADGNYVMCIRGRNPAGLAPVGDVVNLAVNALSPPGAIDSGDTQITIQCPNGPCTTVISVN